MTVLNYDQIMIEEYGFPDHCSKLNFGSTLRWAHRYLDAYLDGNRLPALLTKVNTTNITHFQQLNPEVKLQRLEVNYKVSL